jgi:hypothetical protein
MIRVSKNNRCPVCDHPDWCGMTADGRMAICMRVESAVKTKNGGWLHRLSAPLIKPLPKPEPKKKSPADMYALMNRYKLRCTDALCRRLAGQLGVSPAALRELEIGYDGVNYTFPMRNGLDRVIGVKLRAPKGGKFCVPGSQLGIYWPICVSCKSDDDLYICEGESDCAAMLDLGFSAIGRPSCSAGTEAILKFLSVRRRHVIIMADKDEPKKRPDGSLWRPGQEGALLLAKAVSPFVRSVRVIKPPRHKDVRQWYQAGATKPAVLAVVENTRFWTE